MNQTDREELNECRQTMMKVFLNVAQTPENDPDIETFLEAHNRHQELLSQEAKKGD